MYIKYHKAPDVILFFVTNDLMSYIEEHAVIRDNTISVHSVIQMTMSIPQAGVTKRVLSKDDNLYEIFKEAIARK